MTLSLRPYQVEGANWLAGKRAALLADEMGLGKTAQAIAACDEVLAENVLVVCPASVCENWRREFGKFSMTGIAPLVLSYDKAARGDADDWIGDVLVLDEAHYLKSPTSKRTNRIFGDENFTGVAEQAFRVILLTGTPMPNHPAELWPALRALAPETITNPSSGKPYSYWQFVKKFCKTEFNGYGDAPQIVGAKNHEDLRKRLDGFMLRRLKRDVLKDLPPISYDNLYVEGAVPQDHEYLAQAWAAAEVLQTVGVDGLSKAVDAMATLRRLTGLAKVPACVDWIKDFLESGRKLVVFAYHKEVIDELVRNIPTVGLIRGNTNPAGRQAEVDAFQDAKGPAVFIGQIQAAGTGITLTAASDVLFVESDWTPANIAQAAQRVHRIGQTEPCLIRFATLARSIDEDIERALVRKVRDIELIVG